MSGQMDLPILDDDGEPSLLAPLIVLGAMYFPNDPDRIDAFVTAMGADGLREGIVVDADTHGAVMGSGLLARRSFWALLSRDKEVDALLEEARKSVRSGTQAADVLYHVLQLGQHMPRLASVNGATRIVAGLHGRTEREIKGAWSRFKPVAHLWLALHLFQDQAEAALDEMVAHAAEELSVKAEDARDAAERLDDDVLDLFRFYDEENFAYVLSAAEGFRRLAERHCTRGARRPLFADGEAFAVPKKLSIPAATIAFDAPSERVLSADPRSIDSL